MTQAAAAAKPDLADAFWRWSLSAYARPGAADALLRLQDDAGLNVNLALWCVWSATRFEAPPPALIVKAAGALAGFNTPVTARLRAARRALKSPIDGVDPAAADALRDTLKAAELDAEAIEQSVLAQFADALAPARDCSSAGVEARARRTLSAYARLAGAADAPGFSVGLIAQAIEALEPARAPEAV